MFCSTLNVKSDVLLYTFWTHLSAEHGLHSYPELAEGAFAGVCLSAKGSGRAAVNTA